MSLYHVFTVPTASITGVGIAVSFERQVVAIKILDVFPQLGRFSSATFLPHGDHVDNDFDFPEQPLYTQRLL